MEIKRYFFSGIRSLKNDSICVTWQKVKQVIMQEVALKQWKQSYFISEEIRKQQTTRKFSSLIKVSIVVPLYNTPMKYLIEMIESVQKQTYETWELCLVDGSTEKYQKEIEQYCQWLYKEDKRIKYKKLEKNLGISENTNMALKMAKGEYIGLLDHDDLLHPSALYEVMCVIEKEKADFIYTDEAIFEKTVKNLVTVHFKPDYGLDTLRANNYICHFSVFRKALLEKTGNFRKEYDGSQDHDMVLRLTKEATKICHIPKLLYFWRSHDFSVAKNIATKSYAVDAGIRAVKTSIETYGEKVKVESSKECPTIYRLNYVLKEEALVSIIILCKDKEEYTKQCIQSVLEKSTYKKYEIIVVSNKKEKFPFKLCEEFQKRKNIRIIFSEQLVSNIAKEAKGKYMLFLHNTVKVINDSWIEEMLMYAQREDIGAVGGKLYYPDNTIQHAGIFVGLKTEDRIGYSHRYQLKESSGYMGRLCYAQNVSAVTSACMMVRKEIYEQLGGFNENFTIVYDGVDFCMRVRKVGYAVIFTPYAQLYNYQDKVKKLDDRKKQQYQKEVAIFKERWKEKLENGDPYYNPNFNQEEANFMLKNYYNK